MSGGGGGAGGNAGERNSSPSRRDASFEMYRQSSKPKGNLVRRTTWSPTRQRRSVTPNGLQTRGRDGMEEEADPDMEYEDAVDAAQRLAIATPEEKLAVLERHIGEVEKSTDSNARKRIVELRIQQVALLQLVHTQKSIDVVKAFWRLAESYMENGMFPQTVEHAMKARDLNIALGDDESRQVHPSILLTLGLAHTRLGQLKEARNFLSKALKYSVAMYGDDDVRNAPMHMALAAVAKRESNFNQALESLQSAWAIKQAAHGDEHPELADLYVLMAKVHAAKVEGDENNDSEAAELYGKAHDVYVATGLKLLGADAGLRLGRIYTKQGKLEEAEHFLAETVREYEKTYGPLDLRTVAALRDLGLLLVKWQRFEEARGVLKRLMRAERELYGPESVRFADTCRVLGTVYLADARWEEALSAYQTVYKVYREEYGKTDKKTTNIANRIREVKAQIKKAEAQVELQGQGQEDYGIGEIDRDSLGRTETTETDM
mmetsp:Transcript_25628/g.42156  ORF Transcript_25628/g.42156 Transcript_25628/m.42156 type:complete len:490 (+) Transcript_25628:3-1472(+)